MLNNVGLKIISLSLYIRTLGNILQVSIITFLFNEYLFIISMPDLKLSSKENIEQWLKQTWLSL